MTKAQSGMHVPARDEGRVPWVDYAKGLCIIMVVMMHTTLGVEKAAGTVSWLNAAIEFARPFRMPDFFLISGLFLARVIGRDWRTYLDRKVVHFLYFYVLWVVIQWAMKDVYPAYKAGDPAGAGWDLLSAVWDPPGTLWFIYMLPIFFVLAKLVRPLPPVLVLGAAALLQAWPRDSAFLQDSGLFMVDEFCERLVFFLAGTYAAEYVFRFADLADRHRRLALGGLALWGLVNGLLVQAGIAHAPVVGLLLGLVGALAVITTGVLLSAVNWLGALRYCGQHSLVVYLAFFVPMAFLRTVLLKLGVIDDLGTLSLLITAVSVVLPLILHRVVKGGPLRFLFERPAWAWIAPKRPAVPRERLAMVAAE